MATSMRTNQNITWSSDQQKQIMRLSGKKGPAYLKSTNKEKRIPLGKSASATMIIRDLKDTIYREREAEVNGWGKFYLPETVKMKFIGVVEGTSCPCEELVVMTCEDKKIYAYDGEELHLVASNLQELVDDGIEYPSSKSYYHGEAFKDMTKEDWAEVRRGPVGRKVGEKHRKLLASMKAKLMENHRLAQQRAAILYNDGQIDLMK